MSKELSEQELLAISSAISLDIVEIMFKHKVPLLHPKDQVFILNSIAMKNFSYATVALLINSKEGEEMAKGLKIAFDKLVEIQIDEIMAFIKEDKNVKH